MRTPLFQPAAPIPTATVSDFISTFAIVLAAVVGLVLFDTALARVDASERKAYAVREFTTGQRLIAGGKVEEGLEHLRTATMLDGENSSYSVALSQAILADGRPREAEQLLVPLLERDETDGSTNLAMARVLTKEGKVEQAKAYYHRAIYGLWPTDANRNRTAARFELIDLLARSNAKQELLAELLPIQDDSTNDLGQRKRIAHLFVVAGSPARAVVIFREILRRDSKDADAFVGLAEAALSLGDFATARTDLLAAQKLSPEDSINLQPRVALTDSVISLDPTQSGLSLPEQVRRSRNLLQMTLTSVRKCLGQQAPQVAAALDSATLLLVSGRAGGQAQSVEANLSLAEQLWGLQRSRCAPEREDGALALIHNRITK
ncbi:MAG TPA: tetratricopeptide repeat protein [Gemmatimonadaceae bacterium]|nr:tetratricopeptide repeat protein [Gemmatimonadaceae bacterium]